MTVSLRGFPVTRFNNPHHPLPSSVLPCSNNNLPRRILPILLLSFLSSTLPVASAQGGLRIDPLDPLPQQCGSFTFTWSGGVPPYTFRITTADSDPTTLRDPFGDDNGTENTTYTWDPVDIQGGTSLLAEVKDSNHQKATADPFMIQSSGDGSCLGTSSSASSTTSSTSSGDSASATSSTPIPSLSSSSTPTPSSPSSSSSQTSSDRLSTGAIAGIAVGLAILILLAVGAFFYFRRRRRAVRGAAGLLGGAKYRAARSSAGTSTKSIEPPVTFWNANLFVREKTATTQVRDSLLSPLIPRPDLGPPTLAPRGTPALHSKRDDELVSLVDPESDSDSDASDVLNTRSPHPPLSPTLSPTSSPPSTPADASRGHLPDGIEPASTTGGDAGSRPHGSRP